MIEIINKPLLLHLVGYLYYWQMGFISVIKGLTRTKPSQIIPQQTLLFVYSFIHLSSTHLRLMPDDRYSPYSAHYTKSLSHFRIFLRVSYKATQSSLRLWTLYLAQEIRPVTSVMKFQYSYNKVVLNK